MESSYCPQIRDVEWSAEPSLDWRRDRKPSNDAQWRFARIDEIVSKAIAAAHPVATEADIEVRFGELAGKWQQETGHLSSVTKRVMHPSYQSIVGMGQEVVPILLRDLQHNRRDWFWALSAITQANPIDPADAGKVDKMISAWVNWGTKKGLI